MGGVQGKVRPRQALVNDELPTRTQDSEDTLGCRSPIGVMATMGSPFGRLPDRQPRMVLAKLPRLQLAYRRSACSVASC